MIQAKRQQAFSTALPWDPYKVWQVLLHRHPVRIEDPASSCGHIDRQVLVEFCEAIADYPDFLQDALLVIAHAQGCEFAATALDDAVREALTGHRHQPPDLDCPRQPEA